MINAEEARRRTNTSPAPEFIAECLERIGEHIAKRADAGEHYISDVFGNVRLSRAISQAEADAIRTALKDAGYTVERRPSLGGLLLHTDVKW